MNSSELPCIGDLAVAPTRIIMSNVGQKEILTQKHVIQLFKNELGYRYLGHWSDRVGNSNVEEALLSDWLKQRGHSDKIITQVLR